MTNPLSEAELSRLENMAKQCFLTAPVGKWDLTYLLAEVRAARAEGEQMRAKTLEDALTALQNVKELYMLLEAGAKKDADWNAMATWGRCRKAVNAGMETVRALTTPEEKTMKDASYNLPPITTLGTLLGGEGKAVLFENNTVRLWRKRPDGSHVQFYEGTLYELLQTLFRDAALTTPDEQRED